MAKQEEATMMATPSTTEGKDSTNRADEQAQDAITMSIQACLDDMDAAADLCGPLAVSPINAVIEQAKAMPDPVPLFRQLWNVGEMACLFSDTNLGKSILAVQIAAEIARTQPVLYLDLELSPKQLQGRYTDPSTGETWQFPANLRRANIDPDSYTADDTEQSLLQAVETYCLREGIAVAIVDNLTWLCANAEKGEDAGAFMMALQRLKLQHGWSILVIAHTPKRPPHTAITMNDLAGSRRLANFFDNIFALGAVGDPSNGRRYVKQLKYRAGEFTHGESQVLTASIVKRGAWLGLEFGGTAAESDLLANPADLRATQAQEMARQGKTQQDIALSLGINQSTVSRLLRT